MDLAKILADLKAAQDDFRQSDKAFATATFCQHTCQSGKGGADGVGAKGQQLVEIQSGRQEEILDEVVKGTENEEFENLVVGIWIIVSSVNDMLPQLIEGPQLTELAEKLFRQCARVILNIKWQQLDPSEQDRQNLENALSICHQSMEPLGFTRFGEVIALMTEPWTDRVLTMVMGSEEDNEEGEGLAYIKGQDPEILQLRVDLMYQENCDEFALNLCSWCLKHPALAADFTLHKIKFILLHRLGCIDRLQEECQCMGLVDSIRLINSLHGKEEHKELCTMLAQTFLIQNWIKPSDNYSKVELLRLWIRLQYQADEDQDNFISNLWAVAKVSRSTEQLLFIIDAVREKCGDKFLQFYLDLCIFAINVDKGYWEKLKEATKTGPNEELTARKRDMAQVCDKLAHIVSHVSPKIAFCCALTSFAMMPSETSLQAVRDAHRRKSFAEVSTKAQCCSNCAADQGECLKNDHKDQASRDVNVATLYEVERLCSMLRPSYLSCDSDLASLLSLCKQYLMKEKGEPVKSVLLPHKSLHPLQEVSPAVSGAAASDMGLKTTPIQQNPVSVRKTVDASSNVSNVAIPSITGTGHSSGKSTPGGRTASASQAAAASTHIIQKLVLNQLPSDTVQILLNLIHSKQVSPVHLNHIMTKNPDRSVHILQNLVNHFKQAGVKQMTDEQMLRQGTLQSPQIQQKLSEQQPQVKQPAVQQQHIKTEFGMPVVTQSAAVASGGQLRKDHVTGGHQQSSQENIVHRPLTGQTRTVGRVAQTLESVSQQLPLKVYPFQQARVPASCSPMVQRGQQIRPVAPSVSGAQFSNTSEVKVTAPVQIMTLKQPTLLQTTSGAQIHTSSKIPTHMSGGRAISLQKIPQIVRLPSTSSGMSGGKSTCRPKILPKTVHRLPEQTLTYGKTATANSQVSLACSENAGNRHYSINNLLFTGEQQNSTLSITLPDTLPEISVDSISDTLQALSGPSYGGSQVTLTGPGTQMDLSASFSSDTRQPCNMSSVLTTPSVSRQDPLRSAQIQISVPLETSSIHQNSATVASMPFSARPAQDSNTCGQSLPSFSSLFLANPSALHVSVPITSASSSAFIPQTAVMKTSPGQTFGQKLTSEKKLENIGVKKSKEWHVSDKEKMMQLLKQAMTIKVEKKENSMSSGLITTDTQTSSQCAVGLSASATLGGSKCVRGSSSNLQTSATRPLFQQSPHLMQSTISKPISQQPAQTVLQYTTGSHPTVVVSASIPTVDIRTCMSSSLIVSSSVLTASQHTPVATYPVPSFSGQRNVQSRLTPSRNIVTSTLHNFPSTSAPVTATPVRIPVQQNRHPAAGDSINILLPTQTLVNPEAGSSGSAQAVDPFKTHPRTEGSKVEGAGKIGMEAITSEAIPTSILPEGGGVIERARSGNQSIATYRCIICARAFMTLDALRFHVKQVCRPGLNVSNSVTVTCVSKTKPNEAGVETSTVFQCMRCFELCISEAGIREHKLVCSKGFKLKAKPKSKVKPKVMDPEAEEATEAKVKELLNKCLGENREKLMQEAEVQAAKQANSKKKLHKKRPSVDEEISDGSSGGKKPKLGEASSVSQTQPHAMQCGVSEPVAYFNNFMNEEPSTSTSLNESVRVPTSAQCVTTAFSSHPVTAVSTSAIVSFGTGGANQIHSIAVPMMSHVTTCDTITLSVEAKDVNCKPQPEKFCDLRHVSMDISSSSHTANDNEVGGSVGQLCLPDESSKTETSENTDCRKQEVVEEAVTIPQYQELSGSCGGTFFKCSNCGQTLCSMQSFREHWQECIAKKPLTVTSKSGHEPKETAKAVGSRIVDISEKVCSESASWSGHSNEHSGNAQETAVEGTVKGNQGLADCNMDRFPAKQEDKNGSAAPLVKQSVVLLEKINLPEKSSSDAFRIVENADSQIIYAETDEHLQTNSCSRSSHECSPVVSVKRCTSKDSGLWGKHCKIQRSSPTVKKDIIVKVISKESRQSCRHVSVTDQPEGGDSRYCCVCKCSFSQHIEFVQHLASIHLKLYTLQTEKDNNAFYVCHLCQQSFSPYSQYISHVAVHSQAIIQKFDEKNLQEDSSSEPRSMIAGMDMEELTGQPKKHHVQDSPGDVSEDSNRNEFEAGGCPLTLSSAASKVKMTPSPAGDRRSSGRAAQKQALNKIYISSLGITSFVEPLKDSNKRKYSGEEKSIAANRPKRSKLSESVVDFRDSEEDEENSGESSGETEEDDSVAKKDSCHDAAVPLVKLYRAKAGDKASMGTCKSQAIDKHGSGKSSLSVNCQQSSALPFSSPQIHSQAPLGPKKPSFIDSFLNFVSSRSPEAPLPLHQPRRRYSYFSDNLESSTSTTSSLWRRSSCEEHMKHSSTNKKSPKPFSTRKSVPESDCVSDVKMTPKAKSSQIPCVSKMNSSDYRNVYFYGEFEKQLTQQCKVNLGHRVKPEEVQFKQTAIQQLKFSDEPVISVKKCIVNLGPKVNAAALIKAASCSSEENKLRGLSGNVKCETGAVSKPRACDMSENEDSELDTVSDSDTVVASCSALSPVRDTEDTISLDGIPLASNPSGSLPAAGELCVEPTLSVLPLAKVNPPNKDTASLVNSMTSQVAAEDPTTPAHTGGHESPSLAAVTMSSLALDFEDTLPVRVNMLQTDGNTECQAECKGGRNTTGKTGEMISSWQCDGIKDGVSGYRPTSHVITGDVTNNDVGTGDITTQSGMTADDKADNVLSIDSAANSETFGGVITGDVTNNDVGTGDITTQSGMTADDKADNVLSIDSAANSETFGGVAAGDAMTEEMLANNLIAGVKVSDATEENGIMDNITADNAFANSVNTDGAAASYVTADFVTLDSSSADHSTRDDITADRATEDDISAGSATRDYSIADHPIGDVTDDGATGDDLSADRGARDDMTADSAIGNNIIAYHTTRDDITSNSATGDDITADCTTGEDISADPSTGDGVTVDYATGDDISADHATEGDITSDQATGDDLPAEAVSVWKDNIATGKVAAVDQDGATDSAAVVFIKTENATVEETATVTAAVNDATRGCTRTSNTTEHGTAGNCILQNVAIGSLKIENTTLGDIATDSVTMSDVAADSETEHGLTQNAAVTLTTIDRTLADDITSDASAADATREDLTVDSVTAGGILADCGTTGDITTDENASVGDLTRGKTTADDVTADSGTDHDIAGINKSVTGMTEDSGETGDSAACFISLEGMTRNDVIDVKMVTDNTTSNEIALGTVEDGDFAAGIRTAENGMMVNVADEMADGDIISDIAAGDSSTGTADDVMIGDITADNSVHVDIITDYVAADGMTEKNVATADNMSVGEVIQKSPAEQAELKETKEPASTISSNPFQQLTQTVLVQAVQEQCQDKSSGCRNLFKAYVETEHGDKCEDSDCSVSSRFSDEEQVVDSQNLEVADQSLKDKAMKEKDGLKCDETQNDTSIQAAKPVVYWQSELDTISSSQEMELNKDGKNPFWKNNVCCQATSTVQCLKKHDCGDNSLGLEDPIDKINSLSSAVDLPKISDEYLGKCETGKPAQPSEPNAQRIWSENCSLKSDQASDLALLKNISKGDFEDCWQHPDANLVSTVVGNSQSVLKESEESQSDQQIDVSQGQQVEPQLAYSEKSNIRSGEGQMTNCEELLEEAGEIEKAQMDSNAEKVMLEGVQTVKSLSTPKGLNSELPVLTKTTSCDQPRLLSKEPNFSECAQTAGTVDVGKELPVDPDSLFHLKSVLDEESLGHKIPVSEVGEHHTKILVAETEEQMENFDCSQITVDSKKPASDKPALSESVLKVVGEELSAASEEANENVDNDHFEFLPGADANQRQQTTVSWVESETASTEEVILETGPVGTSQNHDSIEMRDISNDQRSADDKKQMFEVSLSTELHDEKLSSKMDVESIPSASKANHSQSDYFQQETVCGSFFREEESQEPTEKQSVQKSTAELSLAAAEKEQDQDQEQDKALSEQSSLKRQTMIQNGKTVTLSESESTAHREIILSDESECHGWDTGEDEVNVIDLPDESLSGVAHTRLSEETRSLCEGECSEPSHNKHKVSGALHPSSKKDQAIEINSCAVCLPPESTVPLEMSPVLSAVSPTHCEGSGDEAVMTSADILLVVGSTPSILADQGQSQIVCERTHSSPYDGSESGKVSDAYTTSRHQSSNGSESLDNKQSSTGPTVDILADQRNCSFSHAEQQPPGCLQQMKTCHGSGNCPAAVEDESQGSTGPFLLNNRAVDLLCAQSVDSASISSKQLKTGQSFDEAQGQSASSTDCDTSLFQRSSNFHAHHKAEQDVENRKKTQKDCPEPIDQARWQCHGSVPVSRGVVDSTLDSAPMEADELGSDRSLLTVLVTNSLPSSIEITNTSGLPSMKIQDCSSVVQKMCDKSHCGAMLESLAKSENQELFVGESPSVESASVDSKTTASDFIPVKVKDSPSRSVVTPGSHVAFDACTYKCQNKSEDQAKVVGDRTVEALSVENAVAANVKDDTDPESDLPELCIIPDPQGTVIKPNVSDTNSKRKTDNCVYSSDEEEGEIIASLNEPHEVRYGPLQKKNSKRRNQTTYLEIKSERVEVEPQKASPRRPLVGVKSLRRMHKPEPFVWEMDGDEDCRKRQRNERSLRAFRTRNRAAPFSWDHDCSGQDKNSAFGEVTSTVNIAKRLSQVHRSMSPKTGRQSDDSVPFPGDSDTAPVKTIKREPDNEDTDVLKTEPDDLSSFATCKEMLQSSNSSEEGRFHSSGVHNKSEDPIDNKYKRCIKVKTLTTSRQGRLVPRSRGMVRSGSCEKAVLMTSGHYCSARSKRSMTEKERPLRKSRSCDIEYSGMQSEWLQESALGASQQPLFQTSHTAQSTKFRDESSDEASKGAVWSCNAPSVAPRRKSLRQQVLATGSSKADGRNVLPGGDPWEGRVQTRSKQSTEKDMIKDKSGEQGKDSSVKHENENEILKQQYDDTKRSKGELHCGIHTPKSKTSSSLNDSIDSSRFHSSLARRCRSRDRVTCKDNAGGDVLQEPAQPDLNDCVRYLRSRLSSKLKSAGVSDTCLLEDRSSKKTSSACKSVDPDSRKPVYVSQESVKRNTTDKKFDILVDPKSYAVPLSKRTSDWDAHACGSRVQAPKLDDSAHSSGELVTHKLNKSEPSQQQYLTAMVRRRRPGSWRTGAPRPPLKKPRIAMNETPQYEIIRVEPLTEMPTDDPRTRFGDSEEVPRTVHTRVSVEDFTPSHRPEPSKAGNDQKWQINRHITPSEKKKTANHLFRFSFKRARARTQTN